MSDIEDIASKHLGRAGDGTVVKPYVTPDAIDPNLLVAIPRQLNRTQYNIEEDMLPFHGFDTWNCYEVSALCDNGYPANLVVKITYPSNSKYIVESKSLKLYLNSFNMHKLGPGVLSVALEVKNIIKRDLEKVLKSAVDVTVFDAAENAAKINEPAFTHFYNLQNYVDYQTVDFSAYNEDPAILKVDSKIKDKPFRFFSTALRSNCRVTNQPDWGDVYIYMESNQYPTLDSLMQYIVSMRKENHFHEEICECIYKRLWDLFDPRELMVACLYTRRGGIDINPLRASSLDVMIKEGRVLMTPNVLVQKTMRQ